MKALYTILFVLVFILFTGCKDNPVEVQEDETLIATLTISDDHIHTLSEITYTVTVTNNHGEAVTNLETIEVQRKAHDATEWRGTELTLVNNAYVGTYTFNSSGEYEMRVAGMRQGSTVMEVMYTMEGHLEVNRTHEVIGTYRIEYESFPGHIHEGDTAAVKFWVMESEKNANDVRPPIEGLATHIHCNNADNTLEHHDIVTEEAAGVYTVEHIFNGAGEASIGMHFTAPDNTEIEAEFHVHVAHGH